MEYEPVRTDMVALLKGFTRVRRDKYHVLRIGSLSDESPRRIFQQMNNNGTLITTPPSIRALRAKQRRFRRKVWPLIMRTVVEDEDLYNDVSKNLAKPENSAAEETEEADTATYATPSPNKKAQTVAQPSQPTPPPNSTTSSATLSATSSVLRVLEQFTPTVTVASLQQRLKWQRDTLKLSRPASNYLRHTVKKELPKLMLILSLQICLHLSKSFLVVI